MTTMITTAKEFIALNESDDPEEKYRATHDSASENVWLDVLDKYPDAAFWVIHNKTIPVSILRILAKSTDPHIRWAVASKRKLDRELFEELARDEDEDVRRQIAYNKKTPHDILINLAKDLNESVAEVARNRLEENTSLDGFTSEQ